MSVSKLKGVMVHVGLMSDWYMLVGMYWLVCLLCGVCM
jgi:hypothetical protein